MKFLRAVFIGAALAFSMVALLPAAQAESTELTVLLAGKQDDVLALLRKGIDAEFADGVRSNAPKGVGYQVQFRTFLSGSNILTARLFPLSSGDATEPILDN